MWGKVRVLGPPPVSLRVQGWGCAGLATCPRDLPDGSQVEALCSEAQLWLRRKVCLSSFSRSVLGPLELGQAVTLGRGEAGDRAAGPSFVARYLPWPLSTGASALAQAF